MSKVTEEAIMTSFIKLINEMPFDKIRVKDIVNDCGINRNTFYYHYSDIYDLLRSVFELRVEEVLKEADDTAGWQENFLKATEFALENKKAIYHIYRTLDRTQLEQYLHQTAGRTMEQYVRQKARTTCADETDIELIISFYQNAIVGMVMEWLDGGMEQEPKQFIRRMAELQEGNISAMLKYSASHRTGRDGE